MTFDLVEVIEAQHSLTMGALDVTVRVSIDGAETEVVPFTYSPNDPHGLSPLVGQWLAANPEFPISDATPKAITTAEIAAEVERRIALPLTVAGLSVGSIQINMDAPSQRNLQGLASVGMYLASADPTHITTFRDYTNAAHDLLPADLVSMGLQVAARIQAVYEASWALKAMDPIPANYTDDGYWP